MVRPTALCWPATGRSREGAWIEITALPKIADLFIGRSREGAWIEIEFLQCKLTYKIWSLP